MGDFEENCVMIRGHKISQKHIIQTQAMGEDKVQDVTFDVARLIYRLSQIKRVYKNDKI